MLADVMDDQLKSMWFSPFQAEEIDTDLDMVKGFINLTEAYFKMRVNLSYSIRNSYGQFVSQSSRL